MKAKWNGKDLVEAVVRYNQVIDALQTIAPRVVEILDGATVTKSGINKKLRAKVDAIINSAMPNKGWARCWLKNSHRFTLSLETQFSSIVIVDRTYATVDYCEISVEVAEWRFGSPVWLRTQNCLIPERLSVEDVQALLRNVEEADLEYRVAKEKLQGAQFAARLFIK